MNTKIRIAVALVAAGALALGGLFAYRHFGWAPPPIAAGDAPGLPRIPADLAQPDALIRSASLARLPRDLLRLPIARDVLTEDLVYYYEQHEDRLALRGALRRIAYEHQLEWSDRVIEQALDAPARIGLWRDGKGALRRFAIVIEKNTLGSILQEAAAVALKDRQLRRAGEVSVGGYAMSVYALTLSPRRSLYIVANAERIVLLSDAGLLFDRDNNVLTVAQQTVSDWLTRPGALGKSFLVDAPQADGGHTLVLGARTMALGYAALMPAFRGLRFDFAADAGWSTQLWLNAPAAAGDAQVWRGAPANPAACLALPFDWKTLAQIAGAAKKKAETAADEGGGLEGNALACWYRGSTLYAPLFAVRLASAPKDAAAQLKALAAWALRAADAGDEKNEADDRKDDKQDNKQAGARTPGIEVQGEFAFFSPDPALVKLALDTLARRHPSVSDQIGDAAGTLALVVPRSLAPMMEREALAALARPGDASLRAVAQDRLAPRLRALEKYPAYGLTLGAQAAAEGWRPVAWRALSGERP